MCVRLVLRCHLKLHRIFSLSSIMECTTSLMLVTVSCRYRRVSITMCTREIYSSHGIPVSNRVYLCPYTAVQILVRGLQRVPNPSSLFVPNKAMLEWAFRQPGLASGAARSWVRRVDCCLPTQALQRGKGINLFSSPRNLKIRRCFRVLLLALHIICSLCSGWSC